MLKQSPLIRLIRRQFTQAQEEDYASTMAEIKEGIIFKGYNLWILGFAMLIACIGLTTDSSSAIVGAMLISPLMGPIVGYAFSLSINDRGLQRESIRNWIWMTLSSLIASIIFFLINPFHHDTTSLHSFEKASIFDIMLAFFGGMAGFIGIIKKEGVKIIAGVAVATACMPPLCTAGFGIANGNLMLFIGGFYFYLINCLFIGLATFILARFFGYSPKNQHSVLSTWAKWFWNFFIIAMFVPAMYIAILKWQEEHKKESEGSIGIERIEKLEQKVKTLDSLLQIKNSQ
ncbi:MAG: DUF389 domain-containing protein [Bacteroidia bacterium]|nr:DUF389 domain-containing protein [Bacteroidia bacterium]